MLRKELIDQSAHAAAAFLIVGLLILFPSVLTATLGGLACGLIREITEDGSILSPGSLRDLAGWTLGGLIAGLLFL